MLIKVEKEKETKMECECRLKIEPQHTFFFFPTHISLRSISQDILSPMVIMGESAAVTTDLTPCLWLPGLGVGAGEEGRAWRPGKAEVSVLPGHIKTCMAVSPLEGDDVTRWKRPWLENPGLGFTLVHPLCRSHLHSMPQHSRMWEICQASWHQ